MPPDPIPEPKPNDLPVTDPDFGLFTADAKFSKENGRTIMRGVMLEPGEFKTNYGPRVVTPKFILDNQKKWIGKPLCVVDKSHPDFPPLDRRIGRITKVAVNTAGQGIYEADTFNTTLARDTIEVAQEYGRLGVSIDGPISLAYDHKTMLDIEPRYLALLAPGEASIKSSYAEVGKFSAGAGAFDSFNPKSEESLDMTQEEIQKLTKERDEMALKVKEAEAKFATADKSLTEANTKLVTVQAERDEAERVKLLDETAKFAKKFGDKEPAATATLPDLRALRAGQAEKALAKFAEGKTGADLQQTAPPVGEKAKPRLLIIE